MRNKQVKEIEWKSYKRKTVI